MKVKDKKVIIIHFLVDGREVKSVKGREVPLNDKTQTAYEILTVTENDRR